MSKVAVVYWSGTGNTEAMAREVLAGIESGGGQGVLFTAAEFDASMVSDYDSLAFGCPAMGAEQLEDFVFEPMFESCKAPIGGMKLGLFGSYGWGDGQWMRTWEESCLESGAELGAESVICSGYPEAADALRCRELGKALV